MQHEVNTLCCCLACCLLVVRFFTLVISWSGLYGWATYLPTADFVRAFCMLCTASSGQEDKAMQMKGEAGFHMLLWMCLASCSTNEWQSLRPCPCPLTSKHLLGKHPHQWHCVDNLLCYAARCRCLGLRLQKPCVKHGSLAQAVAMRSIMSLRVDMVCSMQLARAASAQEDLKQDSALLALPQRRALLLLMLDMLRALPAIQQQTGAATAIQQSASRASPSVPLKPLSAVGNGHASCEPAGTGPGALAAPTTLPPASQASLSEPANGHPSSEPSHKSALHTCLHARPPQQQLHELAHVEVRRQRNTTAMSENSASDAPASATSRAAADGDALHPHATFSGFTGSQSTRANDDNGGTQPSGGRTTDTGQHQGERAEQWPVTGPAAPTAPSLTDVHSSHPTQAPYAGFRSDLVAGA